MRWAWPVAEIRAAEDAARAGLPPGTLMQRAAAAMAVRAVGLLSGRVYGAQVLVLAGGGDNGGDALWVGERLARRGAAVSAVLLRPDKAPADAVAALRAAGGRVLPDAAPPARVRADLVVDGLVGMGGAGPLRPDAAAWVGPVAASGAAVLAVDVPSGVDADTGAVPGDAMSATLTVTPGAYKQGLLAGPGAERAGRVERADIGLGPFLPPPRLGAVDPADVGAVLPVPAHESSKYTRGVLGLVAGSASYVGAAVLSCGGAVRGGGAGYVRFVSTEHPADAVRAAWPEVVTTTVAPGDGDAVLAAGRVQAWACGPGIGTDDASAVVVAAVLSADVPVLLDADALTVVAQRPELLARRSAPTLLTPHEGEFARLAPDVGTDELAADRIGCVRRVAAQLGVTVLLKGSRTIVADPDGQARIADEGTGWLATAGSGDVLTGVAGSLLAGGLPPLAAGVAGAWLHGRAARRCVGGGGPLIPTDLHAQLPHAFADALAARR
jgi:ADP-dependent NAD(P)H-hydrate dehydratase / NAD(P)H-hydrate epimerase